MFDFLKQKDRTPPVLPEGTVRRHFSISGQVQGVGFRYRARYAAQALELTGWVENEDDGSVTLEAQGRPADLDALVPLIVQSNRWAQIDRTETTDLPVKDREYGFDVKSGE